MLCALDVVWENDELDASVEHGPQTVHDQGVPQHRQTPLSPSLICRLVDVCELSISGVKACLHILHRPTQVIGKDEWDQVSAQVREMVDPVESQRVAERPHRYGHGAVT